LGSFLESGRPDADANIDCQRHVRGSVSLCDATVTLRLYM